MLEAHSLLSLAYAKVNSKRDLVISKGEGEGQHPRLSSDFVTYVLPHIPTSPAGRRVERA